MMCQILAERGNFILLTLKIDYGYDTPKRNPGGITYGYDTPKIEPGGITLISNFENVILTNKNPDHCKRL